MGTGGIMPVQLNPPPGQDFGPALFYSSPSDPVYRIQCNKPGVGRCPLEGSRIHIPALARPAQGSDASMTVIDRASDREYDFWRVQTAPLPRHGGTMVVGRGGSSQLNGWGAGSFSSCANAACIAPSETTISYRQLAAGQIDHALYLVVGCSNGLTVYPASPYGGGGRCDDPTNAPATGQWLQLNMSNQEIDALPVPKWQNAIYKAFARYGGVIADEGSSGGLDFQIESPETYTALGLSNPFIAWAESQRNIQESHIDASVTEGGVRYSLDLGSSIDWTSKLRVIDPCVIDGSC